MTLEEALLLERKVATALGIEVQWCMVRECFITPRGEEFRPLLSNSTAFRVMVALKMSLDWVDMRLWMYVDLGEGSTTLTYQLASWEELEVRTGIASLAAYYAERKGLCEQSALSKPT